jgi:hypothetical protein
MKARVYRILIVTTLTALAGLLVMQIYWFVHAYKIEEAQFDKSVNLALRNVADNVLIRFNTQHPTRLSLS